LGRAAGIEKRTLDDLQLVTEYGAQALPSEEMLRQFIRPEALFPPDWPHYTRRCFQPEMQFDYIPTSHSLAQMIADSQAYQARFIQYHTEYYRRYKLLRSTARTILLPTTAGPAITWSVVDYSRAQARFSRPKTGHGPLQVLLEFGRTASRAGQRAGRLAGE
jgi:hypothetical protein